MCPIRSKAAGRQQTRTVNKRLGSSKRTFKGNPSSVGFSAHALGQIYIQYSLTETQR